MPTYEYKCDDCSVEFEELLIMSSDIASYSEQHPCPVCGKMSPRIASAFAFAFKAPAGQTQGSGVHGNSGVHDLDYPTLDKAVGRSAEKRWGAYKAQQTEINKIRKESGTNALTTDASGKLMAADKEKIETRDKAIKTFKSAIKKDV